MSAEGMPREEPSLLSWPLRWLTRIVLRVPVPTLALGIALALVALVLSLTRMGFHTSRLDLLNSDSSYNRLWIEYINEFGDEEDVVVVVEGNHRDDVVPVLESLSEEIARHDHLFHAVLHEVDLSKIRGKGLHYLSHGELRGVERFLSGDEVQPILQGDWARLNVSNMATGMCARMRDSVAADAVVPEGELGRLCDSLLTALSQNTATHPTAPQQVLYRSPWPQMPGSVATLSELSSEYLLTNEGQLGFVLLRLAKMDDDSFSGGSEGIDSLRRLIANTQERFETLCPDLKIGLTGLPVMENDEMRASRASMIEASLLSLVGVACLFVAGFGGVRHPMMTVGCLLLAMAWSFGYITLAVGHLNILSVSFGVILIGLGIDFGIHYVARYLQLRAQGRSGRLALEETAGGVGPGILTGAVTTSIAFFMAGLTEFTGIAELGVIAGGGILLCCAAALTVLPAMVYLSDVKRRSRVLPAPLDIHAGMGPLLRRPRLLLCVTLAGTVFVACGMRHLWYDHNLLNLQPAGLESVELEKKLLTESDQSVWFALSIAESPEDLRQRKARFEDLSSVERVEDIARFFPDEHAAKGPFIERIYAGLARLPERPDTIPVDSPDALGRVLAHAQSLVAQSATSEAIGSVRLQRQIEQIRHALRQMPVRECLSRLNNFQQQMAGDLLTRLHILRAMANPEPPLLSDLPQGLVDRFVAPNSGRYLLKIYAKADIWDMEAMKQFVHDVRSVDPRATGNPLQTYEASLQMKQSYEQAAWYALAAILFVLFLDFRNLWCTLLAMTPVAIGMLQMFGLLGALNIPLNPANMIVLPLIMGIGIDDGVHVIHDFRRQAGRYRMSSSTASAVLITSLTTMIGFGSLMIASHRGLQSLGRVLTIGVTCCMFTSLVMLPALLAWITRHRSDDSVVDVEGENKRGGGIRLPMEDTAGQTYYRRDSAHVDHGGVPRPVRPRRAKNVPCEERGRNVSS